MRTDEMMHRLAAEQHCLVAVTQLRAAGITRSAVRHRVAIGDWEQLGPRVLRWAGSPVTEKQRLMAAVLDAGAGAVASHEAAAVLWGLPGFWPGPLDVSRPRGADRRRPGLGEVHDSRRLRPRHVTVEDGIPVTEVGVTLLDLAGAPGLPASRVERAVDNAIALSPGLLARLHRLLGELGGRGRPGAALMRTLLEERPLGYVAPASGLEARVIDLLDEAGVTTRRQIDLGGEHWIGRVDLLAEGTNVVVEADSAVHHSSLGDRRRDQRRDSELAALGFTVVRVTDDEAFHRPWLIGPRVLAAVARAGARSTGARSGRQGGQNPSQFAGAGWEPGGT